MRGLLMMAAVLFGLGGLCAAAQAKEQRVALPVGTQSVIVTLPEGWVHGDHRMVEGAMTVRLESPQKRVVMLLTMLLFPEPAPGMDVLEVVREMNLVNASQSVEKICVPVALKRSAGVGGYCAFTDAALVSVAAVPKGQYKYVTSGMIIDQGVVANFTLLSNDNLDPANAQAVQMMTVAEVTPPKPKPETPEQVPAAATTL